jgi:tetratricopeptide (TPR) repeat protein
MCVLLSLSASAQAPTGEQLFREANAVYRDGRYEDAAGRYEQILERRLENGAVYYNLGNALLKSGRRGEAVWAYLKARRWLPRDPDVAANLEYAQSLVPEAEPVSVAPPRLVRWLAWGVRLTTAELAGWWTVWLWLTAGCWALCGWWRRGRAVLRPAAWTLTLAGAVIGSALIAKTLMDATPQAVVIEQELAVRFAPQAGGTVHFTLPEGALVRLVHRQAGWVQLRRRDGRAGWARADTLRPL